MARKKKPVERLYPPRPDETDLVIDRRIARALSEKATGVWDRTEEDVVLNSGERVVVLTSTIRRAYNPVTGEHIGHIRDGKLIPLPTNTAPIGEANGGDMYQEEVTRV